MNDDALRDTKRLMGALLRMPPKPHAEMKLKPRAKSMTPKVPLAQSKKRRKPTEGTV
jgi:hypothetical protein